MSANEAGEGVPLMLAEVLTMGRRSMRQRREA